jgi:hypothetical protein
VDGFCPWENRRRIAPQPPAPAAPVILRGAINLATGQIAIEGNKRVADTGVPTQAWVASEIVNGSFVVRTGRPGVGEPDTHLGRRPGARMRPKQIFPARGGKTAVKLRLRVYEESARTLRASRRAGNLRTKAKGNENETNQL